LTLDDRGRVAERLELAWRELLEEAGELAGRGVPFEDEPHLIAELEDHDLWMTFFRDPDRNYLGLMAEVPKG
jgi:hypothetical protein